MSLKFVAKGQINKNPTHGRRQAIIWADGGLG